MNTSDSTKNAGTWPLERKKTPALVQDNPENIEGKDRAGFFDESPVYCFDATCGSINDFNPDKVVQPSIVSDLFGESDQWISITPSGVADKVVSTASTALSVAGDLASAGKDAGIDLLNQFTGKTERPEGNDPSKLDPSVAAEKQAKAEEYSATKQRDENIAAELARINRDLENQDRLTPLRQNISALTGLPEWLSDIVSDGGEVRKDLVAPAEARKKVLETQQSARTDTISNPSKHGVKGPGMSMKDRDSQEKQGQTAQTATG